MVGAYDNDQGIVEQVLLHDICQREGLAHRTDEEMS